MTPIELKEVKQGDVFYERGGLDWYTLSALEDCRYKGDIEILGKTYKQYCVDVWTEFNEKINILITEGLSHYNGMYYKQDGND